MPTTSAPLARELLEGLAAADIEYAILHGEERVAKNGPLSDIDIITRPSAGQALRRLAAATQHSTLRPILHWEYDDGAVSSFWVDLAGQDGVQLDILHDPGGRTRYGIRTNEALDHRVCGTSFPKLRTDHELIYLAVKRWRKGDLSALAGLLPLLPAAVSEGGSVLSSRGMDELERAIGGESVSRRSYWAERAGEYLSARALRRLVYPAGAVVLCDAGPEQLRGIGRQLEKVLLKVHVVGSTTARRDRVRLAMSRYKAHLILEGSQVLRPDAQVMPGSEDTLSHRLVDALWRLECERINRLG